MDHVRSVLNYLSRIGCCFDCSEDSSNQGHEPNERTHLLVDPVSNTTVVVGHRNSDEFINEYPSSLPRTKDEQNALSRIVQDIATNIIDVASMDTHNLEPQEYTDRVKIYSNRLANQWNSIPSQHQSPGIIQDVPNPEQQLRAPVSVADIQTIKSFVHRASIALNDIKVEHREELVVPFRIP